MRYFLFMQALLYLSLNSLLAEIKVYSPTKECNRSFAIFVDNFTYKKTKDEIIEYRNALQNFDNLSTYIVVINNENPDVIKSKIEILYDSNTHFEGVVFIGDIPITMLREAQHLTSAFKMNEERYKWIKSSVPSDRFYEDFDLKFDFLKQDSTNNLLYYYKLKAESSQKINKEIYSGRIKAPVNDESKYDLIKTYLKKVVKSKKNPELLDNAFVFSGHGYNSESLTAWSNKLISLREQFPQMFKVGGSLKHIYHSMSKDMKEILQLELSNIDLDMALFHSHGGNETQYLIGYTPAKSITEYINMAKMFFRSKIRAAKKRNKNIDEAKKYYIDKYNISEKWFEGTFADSVIAADSLLEYNMDIHSEELADFSPQAEFIIFDECFNGAFHLENSISARYLFGSGNVISAIANSVNVIQDKWADKALGLLNYGVSIGNWHKDVNYLENHIIGDPTFHFKNVLDFNLNENIVVKNKDENYWRRLLKNKIPELRALALNKLSGILKNDFNNKLIQIYDNDKSFNVRTHVLNNLAASNSKEFIKILPLTIEDPNEFIRRVSATIMGDIQCNKYIKKMIHSLIHDNSKRVSFNLGGSLLFLNQDSVMNIAKKEISKLPEFVDKKKYIKYFGDIAEKNKRWVNEIISNIKNDTLKISKRLSSVRTLRNYNFTDVLPELFLAVKDKKIPSKIRIAIIEAMGWYNYSMKKSKIIKVMDEILTTKGEGNSILNEALKTKKRLLAGCNEPLTP